MAALRPPWTFNKNDFNCFAVQIAPIPPTKSIGRSVRENNLKIDFQDGRGHLGLLFCLIIFDQQVNLMPPTKFRGNCLFSSGEEAQNKFSR